MKHSFSYEEYLYQAEHIADQQKKKKLLEYVNQRFAEQPAQNLLLYKSLVTWMRALYHIEIKNVHLIPHEGSTLFAANHISFVDAFVLTACLPYPLRFYVDESIYKHICFNSGLKSVESIPISAKGSVIKQAIKETIAAKQKQQMLCIFPEGEVTYSGELQRIKRGVELLAKGADLPVVPVAIEGLWGSVFSRKNKGSFKRFVPHYKKKKITVAFGEPIASGTVCAEKIYGSISQLLASNI